MSAFRSELRPAYTAEGVYQVDITIEGSGTIAGQTFSGELYDEGGASVPGAVSVAILDAAARTIRATVQGQSAAGEFTWAVRRTDDASNLVVALGVLEVEGTGVPPFVSWQEVREQVAGALKVAAADLPVHYAGIASATAKIAQAELSAVWAAKGYSAAQIAAWDFRRRDAAQLAAYHALARVAGLGGYDLKAAEWMDCRERLEKSGVLFAGGKPVAPDGTSGVGGIVAGVMSAVELFADDPSAKWFQ